VQKRGDAGDAAHSKTLRDFRWRFWFSSAVTDVLMSQQCRNSSPFFHLAQTGGDRYSAANAYGDLSREL
jgi:hypothetical protein